MDLDFEANGLGEERLVPVPVAEYRCSALVQMKKKAVIDKTVPVRPARSSALLFVLSANHAYGRMRINPTDTALTLIHGAPLHGLP